MIEKYSLIEITRIGIYKVKPRTVLRKNKIRILQLYRLESLALSFI